MGLFWLAGSFVFHFFLSADELDVLAFRVTIHSHLYMGAIYSVIYGTMADTCGLTIDTRVCGAKKVVFLDILGMP